MAGNAVMDALYTTIAQRPQPIRQRLFLRRIVEKQNRHG